MDDTRPQSVWAAAKRGAWLGLKWTTYIIGPVAVLFQEINLAVICYRIMMVDGFAYFTWKRTAPALFGPLGMYLCSCLWGCAAGVVVLCIVHFFQAADKDAACRIKVHAAIKVQSR